MAAAARASVRVPDYRYQLTGYQALWDLIQNQGRIIGWNRTLRSCVEKVDFLIGLTRAKIEFPWFADAGRPVDEPSPLAPAEPSPPAHTAEDPAPPTYRGCNLQSSEWNDTIPPAMRRAEAAVHSRLNALMEKPINEFPTRVQRELQAYKDLLTAITRMIESQHPFPHPYLEEMRDVLMQSNELTRVRHDLSPTPNTHVRGHHRGTPRRRTADSDLNWRSSCPDRMPPQ